MEAEKAISTTQKRFDDMSKIRVVGSELRLRHGCPHYKSSKIGEEKRKKAGETGEHDGAAAGGSLKAWLKTPAAASCNLVLSYRAICFFLSYIMVVPVLLITAF